LLFYYTYYKDLILFNNIKTQANRVKNGLTEIDVSIELTSIWIWIWIIPNDDYL